MEMVWGGGFRRSQAANSVTTAAGGGQTVDSGISIFRPFCRDSPRVCQVLPNPHPLRAQDKDFIVHSRIHYTSFDISTPLHRSTSSLAPPPPHALHSPQQQLRFAKIRQDLKPGHRRLPGNRLGPKAGAQLAEVDQAQGGRRRGGILGGSGGGCWKR